MYIYICFSEPFEYKMQNIMPFGPKCVTINFLKIKGNTMIKFQKIILIKILINIILSAKKKVSRRKDVKIQVEVNETET